MLPYEHIILIEKETKTPVYRQIAVSLIQAIRSGTLKAGTHLPGSRELAKTLGVHRKTVIAAYEELDAQDWIRIVPRKYVAVSDQIPTLIPKKWTGQDKLPSYENQLNLPFRIIEEDAVEETSSTLPDMIIDDGHPDIRLSPIDSLLKTYRSLTSRRHNIKTVTTGTTQGTFRLREEMVSYLSETRGLNISMDNILITHGAQMSIYLCARLLLNSSSCIIVGKPNYLIANKAFEETGTKLLEVPVDRNGIDTDAIEKICKRKKVTAIYLIPHHHYPTTVTLSAERRMKLLDLSKRFSFIIVEDDYDYDYHFSSSPHLPLASANHNGNIVYIGSFSKMLDPSLRLGFMVAPENFIRQCIALRKLIDVGVDGYMQNALAALIKNGELKRHLKKARKIYHQRRDFLNTLLQEELGEFVSYILPTGGMAIWVKLRPDLPVTLLTTNTKLWILRIDTDENAFRFGFASKNEEELKQAVGFLKRELRISLQRHPG